MSEPNSDPKFELLKMPENKTEIVNDTAEIKLLQSNNSNFQTEDISNDYQEIQEHLTSDVNCKGSKGVEKTNCETPAEASDGVSQLNNDSASHLVSETDVFLKNNIELPEGKESNSNDAKDAASSVTDSSIPLTETLTNQISELCAKNSIIETNFTTISDQQTMDCDNHLSENVLGDAETSVIANSKSNQLDISNETEPKLSKTSGSPKSTTPEAFTTNEGETETSIAPETVSLNEPETESSIEPETETFNEPQTESSNEPQTESSNEPQTESSNEPQTETFNEPQTESSNEPENVSTNEPDVSELEKPEIEPSSALETQQPNTKAKETVNADNETENIETEAETPMEVSCEFDEENKNLNSNEGSSDSVVLDKSDVTNLENADSGDKEKDIAATNSVDEGVHSVPDSNNKTANVEPEDVVVSDNDDVDDILARISKEDEEALQKQNEVESETLPDDDVSEIDPPDIEMTEDASRNVEVVIDDSDDDFDPISLLAVEHSTPDEPIDAEFQKNIGLSHSDESQPSTHSLEESPISSPVLSDESSDEDDIPEGVVDTNDEIDRIVKTKLEQLVNQTVCLVGEIPEHFLFSTSKRKKLGFTKEGTVEELMDSIVNKVSNMNKRTRSKTSFNHSQKHFTDKEGNEENQNSDNQKGFKNCTECGSNKGLKYQVLFHGRTCFLCSDNCFQAFRSKQNLAPPPPGLAPNRPVESCSVCRTEIKNGHGFFPLDTDGKSVCSEECIRQYQQMHGAKQTCAQCKKGIEGRTKCLSWETMEFCNEDCLGKYQQFLGSFCACCKSPVQRLSLGKYCVRFGSDIRQFCSGKCLEEFKRGLKVCTFCQKDLTGCTDGFLAPVGPKGLFKDFCSQQCLSQFETVNSAAGSAPKTKKCSVCQKIGPIKAQVVFNKKDHTLCSDPCVAAFRYANKITNKICDTCHKFFKSESSPLQFEGASKRFCTKMCMNLFVLSHRKIVPCTWCKVKKYNFDMIERVDSNNHVQLFCSLNCLSLFRVSLNATSSRSVQCDHCRNNLPAQYHLTMSDASIRNFCTYQCVIQFQRQFTSVPTLTTVTPTIRNQTAAAKAKTLPQAPTPVAVSKPLVTINKPVVAVSKPVTLSSATPVISSVISLAPSTISQIRPAGAIRPTQTTLSTVNNISTAVGSLAGTGFIPPGAQVNFGTFVNKVQAVQTSPSSAPPATTVQVIREIVVKPPPPKVMKNKMILCKPSMQTKGVACKPHPCHKCTQTEEVEGPMTYIPIPIPVPIYIPVPMHMYTRTVPCPTPFPIPIPVPVFLPTTKSTSEQILQHIKEIRERTPDNPLEAELLMMAEVVASQDTESNAIDKKSCNSIPSLDNNDFDILPSMSLGGSSGDNSLVQEFPGFTEPMLDLETALAPPQYESASLIDEQPSSILSSFGDDSSSDILTPREQRIRQRNSVNNKRRPSGGRGRGGRGRKKARLNESIHGSEDSNEPFNSGNETSFSEPVQRNSLIGHDGAQAPDANLCLKFMFGVNAWKHWVVLKNTQLERGSQSRRLKLFKTDLLQLTADELNYSLCLFVKEVRKPNGEEYAPDSIYYLCLGIQMYIFENGRVDNIFTDAYYEKFTECLNDVVLKQEMALIIEGRYISRIEEEILWESKQLGAHSPHVLLNTLMYFNTKHFGLRNVNDHAQLSFAHIIKHYKKDMTPPHGAPVPVVPTKVMTSTPGKLAILRYYPPTPTKDSKKGKKDEIIYEQIENVNNVLRCPVKLYEFYLSKCPESIRSRSDVFYLYPERSCVPDSPVWYSTQPLGRETLSKMLHRIRMVREINRSNLAD